MDLGKLAKLKICAYGDSKRTDEKDSFEVMFNPTSFSMKHQNVFVQLPGINTSGREANYAYGAPEALNLELVFDGSGVSQAGTLGTPPASVTEQIEKFLSVCYQMDGEIHAPRYLKIQWGTGPLSNFECRLESVDITYQLFDSSGSPLRATLNTSFINDLDRDKRVRLEAKNSPDLTHRRTVKAGDTLPGMCQAIYKSSAHYLTVARFNRLDNFRKLQPGTEIVFPPLAAELP